MNKCYLEVLNKGLQVMDSTAASLCMDNNIELLVFNMNESGNIKKAVARRTNWNNCKGEIKMPKNVLTNAEARMSKAIRCFKT